MRRALSFSVLAFCLALTLRPQPSGFEVASIRLNVTPLPVAAGSESGPPPPPPPPVLRPSPTGITIENASVQYCLMWALGMKSWQIAGPEWTRNNRYNISARTGAPVDDAQLRRMLADLLRERFRFEVRRETKETKVLALVPAPGGSKLVPSDPAKPAERKLTPLPGGALRIAVRNSKLDFLEQILSLPIWPPVVDRTGLSDGFDFTFERPALDAARSDSWLSDIQSALRKQLGLILVEQKTPVETVAIAGGSPDAIPN